jgi:hypothetical protein
MAKRSSPFTVSSGPRTDPLEKWALSVIRRTLCGRFGRLQVKWGQVAFEPLPGGGARDRERAASLDALQKAWGRSKPEAPLPEAASRRGEGVREGILREGILGTDSLWASSLSHSAPAQAAAAVVIRASRLGRRESVPLFPAVGIDLEPADRKLHPRMAGKLRPCPEAEAPGLERIPLLAVWCVKEAIYKSDRLQAGRIIADYNWVRARKWAAVERGWTGWAQAQGESVPRFAVAVRLEGNCWVALALSFSEGPVRR